MAQTRSTRRIPWAAWGFLTPVLLGVAVFFVYPLIMTVFYSFTSFNMLNAPKWNNFANWKYLFTDKVAGRATINTLWFVVVLVPVRIIGAIFVASVLTRARRASGVFRTIYYLPALIPPVASTIAFVFILNPVNGPVNRVLGHIGLHIGWFTSTTWVRPSLAFLGLWVLGDIMVIFLASLLDVPSEQYEAAELDGAGAVASFRYITLPNMRPIILFAAVTGVINTLQYFTEPAVASATAQGVATVGAGQSTTMGWPGNMTLTYGQWLYRQAFGYNLMGYASALAVVMFVVAAVVIILLLRRFSDFNPEVAS